MGAALPGSRERRTVSIDTARRFTPGATSTFLPSPMCADRGGRRENHQWTIFEASQTFLPRAGEQQGPGSATNCGSTMQPRMAAPASVFKACPRGRRPSTGGKLYWTGALDKRYQGGGPIDEGDRRLIGDRSWCNPGAENRGATVDRLIAGIPRSHGPDSHAFPIQPFSRFQRLVRGDPLCLCGSATGLAGLWAAPRGGAADGQGERLGGGCFGGRHCLG